MNLTSSNLSNLTLSKLKSLIQCYLLLWGGLQLYGPLFSRYVTSWWEFNPTVHKLLTNNPQICIPPTPINLYCYPYIQESNPTWPGSRETGSSPRPKISQFNTNGSKSYGWEWDAHLPAVNQVHGFNTRWQPAGFLTADEMININDIKWKSSLVRPTE